MSSDRRLKTLKMRLKSLTASLNLITTFVDNFKEDTQADEVPVRLESLTRLWSDYNTVQNELEVLDETSIDAYLKERMNLESSYYRVKGFLLAHNTSPLNQTIPSINSETQLAPSTSQVRLPDVKLPVFDGKLENWLVFHDLYVSLVHSAVGLSNIQKFYYLRSSLSSTALQLIQSIPLCAANYPVAWDLLLKHFQNPARLKQAYVDALFDFCALKRESATELHSLVEQFEANVKVLQQLGEQTEHWDILLIRMLSSRLDSTTRRDWEEYCSSKNGVRFKDLTEFIQRRVSVLQSLQSKITDAPPSNPTKKPVQRSVSSHGANQVNPRKCLVCSDHHPLYACGSFSKLSTEDKDKEVRRHQLCRNCLRKGHQSKDCSSSSNCRKCRGRHHTLLCSNDSSQPSPKPVSPPQVKPIEASQVTDLPSTSASAKIVESVSCSSTGRKQRTVLLATAVIILVDDNGVEHLGRALLDSGSECCFITERLSQRMKVQRRKIHLPISGIGQSSTHAKQKLTSIVRSRVGAYSTNVEFLVLPSVTIDLPATSVDTSTWDLPPGIQLADPSFDSTNPVDIIIGAEIFFELFRVSGRIPLGDDLPVLVNSVFGWVVSGKSNACTSNPPVIANIATVADVHRLLERFWTIEEDRSPSTYSVEEQACEQHFCQTVSRTPEGRYVVRLPFKEAVLDQLSDNRRTAVRRFHLLQTRLVRNPDLHQQYKAFVDEYLNLDHMERIHDYDEPNVKRFYLPHHAVLREDSTTTKLRVVFDASCKTPTGPSLNDALMVGPTVQEDIRSITMRSRKHPIMIVADIKMMYRQILVDPRDTSVQLIVWKPSPDQPMETYKLKTVTYGTASAPFLATRVLIQLADDEGENFPMAAPVLKKDFYVDDLFSGGKTAAEVIELRTQLEGLLAKGGFQLRKWASNDTAVLDGIPPENRALQTSVDLHRDQIIKTLGLYWEILTDCLRYKIELPTDSTKQPLTKRLALSLIARLYDPLGLVGPVVTTAKVFMQNLWTLKDEGGALWSWDRELPMEYQIRWANYQSLLPKLNNLRINRCILLPEPATVQVHLFADASQLAYGACAYVRSTNSAGLVHVALLSSKSRVAPLKQLSIPRLELCGAVLAAELYEKVKSSLQLDAAYYFWIDSTVVLCWLNRSPSEWNTFVANRTSKIQIATQDCSWNHIAGLENPADCLSRGMPADDILDFNLWWHGPQWLQLDERQWPVTTGEFDQPSAAVHEARRTSVAAPSSPTEPSFVDLLVGKFSNSQRLIWVVGYCYRFLRNCRTAPSERPKTVILNIDELTEAENSIIRLVQQQSFSEEWKQLKTNRPVSSKSRLKWFHPFISSEPEQLIRIGGRLGNALQPYDAKHQVLLPRSHPFSLLLVRNFHERHLHAAPQLLLNLLRQRYWVIGARSLAKYVTHNCIVCFRARPKMLEQFMAELPASRSTVSRPFSITGVDYWGPIFLKPVHRRAAPGKAYVAVFVCFCTKAVHLELVSDLTTAKFLQALRRFVSRRGVCTDLHSDNGRNFLGAANELKQLVNSTAYRNAIAQECNAQQIRWHFNPPKASHFGGLWEAAIQSAQKHFVRVLGKNSLPHDDMETLLCQIEACLNSRPLVPLSDDPSDYEPLTPGHFLTGSLLKSVPDVDYSEIPTNRLTKWHHVQKLYQQLWKRWHMEYLSTLQTRSKWLNPPVQLRENQLVLLRDENSPPMHWQTGRICATHPGPDGVTRVVTVQTPTGQFVRPVNKVCLLPAASSFDQQTTTTEETQSPATSKQH